MERDDVVLLLLREAAALEVGAEVVGPAEAAALAAAEQAGELGDEPPAAMAVGEEEGDGPACGIGQREMGASEGKGKWRYGFQGAPA